MKLSEGKCKENYTILKLNVTSQIKDRLQSLGDDSSYIHYDYAKKT